MKLTRVLKLAKVVNKLDLGENVCVRRSDELRRHVYGVHLSRTYVSVATVFNTTQH